MVYHHDDADDVLQNTLLKFLDIDSFKGIVKSIHGCIASQRMKPWFLNQKEMQNITLEEVKEQALNNLTEDIYFEGDQLQPNSKAIATLPHKQ